MRNMTRVDRWTSEESYDATWIARSEALLDLFAEVEQEAGRRYTIAELGCGANAPLFSICQARDGFTVRKFDIKAWDDETTVLDLNAGGGLTEGHDIAAFSGVLEYLNDVEGALRDAMARSDFLLVSYAFLKQGVARDDSRLIAELAIRTKDRGWRNHLTLPEITAMAARIGVISNVGVWRKQVLMVVRNFAHDRI